MPDDFFKGCTVAFSGLYHSLIRIKNQIKERGGGVSPLSSNVTHLVTTEDQLGTSTVEKAQKYNAFIVTEAWVIDSLAQGQRLPESSYFLGDKQPSSDIAQEKAAISEKATEVLRSSVGSITSFTASPLRLQPSLLETSYGTSSFSSTPSYIPFEEKEEEPVFTSTSSFEEPTRVEPTVDSTPPSKVTSGLPAWVPFDTKGKRVKSRTVKANQKQPVAFSAEFDILGEVTLQLTNLGKNNNKYYVLELHQDPSARHSSPFRVFCHYGRTCHIETNPHIKQQCYRYFSNLQDARICFQNLYDEKTKKGYVPLQLVSSNIGSERAQAMRLASMSSTTSDFTSESTESSTLHPELQRLVRTLYEEASNAITASVNAKITARGIESTLGVLTKHQVKLGEQILLQIQEELQKKSVRPAVIEKLSGSFYTLIPHKLGRAGDLKKSLLDSMAKLEQKLELLQLMKDMLDLISAGGVGNVVDMQYKALKTNIVPLHPNSEEYRNACEYIINTQTTESGMNEANIRAIFAIRRPQEKLYTAIGNIQLYFHGSRACNFVGLLSRGILMPKIVVSRGGGRTDAGLLGNGIYFSDSFTTAAQYAHPDASGSRFVLANRVSLGRCKDYTETQIGMSKPPFGYHSVHGISQRKNPSSAFKDDEFVVFETNQQTQEYLVEFTPTAPTEPLRGPSDAPRSLPSSFFSSKPKPSFSNPTSFPSTQSYAPSSASSFESASTSKPSSFSQPIATTSSVSSGTAATNDEIKQEEDNYRKLFVSDPNNFKLRDPYVHLIDVMENTSSFKYQTQTNEEKSLSTILDKFSSKGAPGSPCVVSSLSKFQENWNAFTENQFQGLNWNNLFVAGGSILTCLQNDFSTSIEQGNPFHASDIDIFIYGLSSFQANEKLTQIYETVKRNTKGSGTVIRSSHAVTILGEYPYRHTQIILRIYHSPAEVLMGFDIDCCCVGFNGQRVFALPRARRALTKQFNLVDLSRRSLTYETRLHKYSKRGYEVKIPTGIHWDRVCDTLYHRRVDEVAGLAKLLILHRIQQTGVSASRPVDRKTAPAGGDASKQPSDSDYSDVHLPWGPNYFITQILFMISNQNKKSMFANASGTPFHSFISDLKGAMDGRQSGNCLCTLCKGGNPPPISAKDETCGRLTWLTQNPGRQILTGSFHPVSDNKWESDAYKQWDPIENVYFRSVSMGSKKPAQKKKVKQKKKFAMKTKATTGNFAPGFGGKQFQTSQVPQQFAPSSQSGFSFGGSSQAQTPAAPPPSGFSFGGSSQGQPPQSTFGMSSQSGFSFGGSSQAQTPAAPPPSGFSFGGSPQGQPPQSTFGMSSQSGFSFGGSSQAQTPEHIQVTTFGKTQGLANIIAHTPPASIPSLSAGFAETIQPQSDVSKLLLLVSQLCRDGLLTQEEKFAMKNLIIRRDATVISALEVFEIERDFQELADSFRRICQLKR